MIQLYAHINDLIQSEEFQHAAPSVVKEVREDILKNGMRDKMNIKPDGYIVKGNTRLGIMKDRLEYFPISLPCFLGLYINSDGTHIRIRKEIIDALMGTTENQMNSYQWSFNAIPPRKEPLVDIGDTMKTGGDYLYYTLEHHDDSVRSQLYPYSEETYGKIVNGTIDKKEENRPSTQDLCIDCTGDI